MSIQVPYDIENFIPQKSQENILHLQFPIRNEEIEEGEEYQEIKEGEEVEKKQEKDSKYLYEKIKYIFICSLLSIPLKVCSLYFACKNNKDQDPCIYQYADNIDINLFDYLLSMYAFYMFLWILDMVILYWIDLNNKIQREKAIFIAIVTHVVINLVCFVLSILASIVYHTVYNTNINMNVDNCSKETKSYINVFIIMNIIVGSFIIFLYVLNTV